MVKNDGLLERVAELAAAQEFESCGSVGADKLVVNPEVRIMCASDRCNAYGHNWMCPPHCGELDEFQHLIESKNSCYIVQTVAELEDEFDFEGMVDAERLHKKRFNALARAIKADVELKDALLLAAGTCTLCPKCNCPDEPCRNPDHAMVSMEAAGLLVSEVCTSAQVPYNHGKGTIAYTSCIVI